MLLPDQQELAERAFNIIKQYGLVYLAVQMRVGKTRIALKAAELMNKKKVLFLSKKKAISSILKDYRDEQFKFELLVTNYEQIAKLKPEYDIIIVDEAHSFGAYPKPSQRTKLLKKLAAGLPIIYCSGTPTPESYSQIYHQLCLSSSSPFADYSNFYKFANDYVEIKEVYRQGMKVRDYSNAKQEKIMQAINHLLITRTQEEAGFENIEINERIVTVRIDENIHKLIKILIKNKYYKMRDGEEIVCDSPVKLQSKIHQLCSGTVRTESGKYKVLDESKAKYIAEQYAGKKIAIFYKFVAEGMALKQNISNWTDDSDVFNSNEDKTFISQIVSGSMGVNLSSADILVFYNIDFSAVQYWQARARQQSHFRKHSSEVHWLFSDGGIESKVYQAVINKKDYTLNYFRRDYGEQTSEKNHRAS